MAHMVDHDGSRADLSLIMQEVQYGDAYHHTESQPQPSVSDGPSHHLKTPYRLARARSVISTEVREQLIADRDKFRKYLRGIIYRFLTRKMCKNPTLAMW